VTPNVAQVVGVVRQTKSLPIGLPFYTVHELAIKWLCDHEWPWKVPSVEYNDSGINSSWTRLSVTV